MIKNHQDGVSLVITFFTVTIILSVVLTIVANLYSETKITRNAGNLITSYYAAESGIEKVSYYDRKEIPIGANSGVCSMCDSCPDCAFCLRSGEDCDSNKCTNCTVTFSTDLTGKSYEIKAVVLPNEEDLELTELIVEATGSYKEAQRAIQMVSIRESVSGPGGDWACGDILVDPRNGGKTYSTVLIGSQCWMRQNMNVGTMIKGKQTQRDDCSPEDKIEKYCYGDNEANCDIYGGLYTFDQATCGSTTPGAQGICPTGWHVPTHDEFTTLERAVCTSGTCADDFPYNATTNGWRGTNEGTTLRTVNSSSFSALLAGYRYTNGSFYGFNNQDAVFWSSLRYANYPPANNAWARYLGSSFSNIDRDYFDREFGFSVRCLKDGAEEPPEPPVWRVCGDNLTDPRDNRTYATVLIGGQCWMRQNINIGTMTLGTNEQGTDCSSVPPIRKYCYDNDEVNCSTYGGLYQWNQTMCGSTTPGAQGICPTGWHIPTHNEFTTLERAVCASDTCATDFPYDTTTLYYRGTNEGISLKTVDSTHFSALPAGWRVTPFGYFNNIGFASYFWSSVKDFYSKDWFRSLDGMNNMVWRSKQAPDAGYSVRCLKDGAEEPPAPVSAVVGSYIFYNNSSFDGNNPAINVADDNAIATNKAALLPGQLATFANYIGYTKGINGIMVDIAGAGTVTASDFTFKVGNDYNGDGFDGFTTLATAPTVDNRSLGGGVTRVTMTWPTTPTPSIKNEWLQVTVKANANTQLANPDVFYFGNLIGETEGNFSADVSDAFAVFAKLGSKEDVSGIYDHDRSGIVDMDPDVYAPFNNRGATLYAFASAP